MPEPAPAPAPDPAPAPAPAPAPKPWYDGKVDADTIGHWDNKGWKKDDATAIAIEASKQARELERNFGVPADQLLKLPKDTADEAGWKAVHQRLGAPAEAKEYDLSSVKFNGAELDAAFADKMRTAMLGAGVPKDKAPTIVKAAVEYLEGAETAETAERAASLKADRDALNKSWGSNFEFNRLTAMQGAKRLGVSEEDVARMEQTLGYKRTMELFHKIGAGTSEDTFTDSAQGGNPTTREGARARMNELQNDQAWAKKLLEGDAATRKEFDSLMYMIAGEAA
jgi:hypothetical protein